MRAAAGQQYLRAQEVMGAMQAGCKLEPSSHSQYLLLHQWCGRWADALRAFEVMRSSGMRQDAATFSAVIEVLWSAGSCASGAAALSLFDEAVQGGIFRASVQVEGDGAVAELRVTPALPGPALLKLAGLFRMGTHSYRRAIHLQAKCS